MGPPAKNKPVLAAPTFRYGSSSYVALAYAKTKNKTPFGIDNLLNFSSRFSNNRDIKRTLEVLISNGSIKEVEKDLWLITPKGRQHILDFASRRKITSQGVN